MKLSVEDYAYDLKKSFEKRNEYIQLVILQYLTKQRYFSRRM